MNCYVYVIVRQCILYCISFELPIMMKKKIISITIIAKNI